MGIMPDVIIARSDEPLEDGIRQKIALFCDVEPECVIENQTLGSLYDVPLMLHEADLDGIVCRRFGSTRRSRISATGLPCAAELPPLKTALPLHW